MMPEESYCTCTTSTPLNCGIPGPCLPSILLQFCGSMLIMCCCVVFARISFLEFGWCRYTDFVKEFVTFLSISHLNYYNPTSLLRLALVNEYLVTVILPSLCLLLFVVGPFQCTVAFGFGCLLLGQSGSESFNFILFY